MDARVPMLDQSEARARARLAGMHESYGDYSVFRVFLRHPPLAKAAHDLLVQLLFRSKAVPTRWRELLIMRIGWATGSAYEWAQHWRLATRLGVPEADILGVRDWQAYGGFDAADRAVLAATDDMLATGMVGDAAWEGLVAETGGSETLLELVVCLGHWRLYSEVLQNLAVPLEDGVKAWPPDGVAPTSVRRIAFDRRTEVRERIARLTPEEAAMRARAYSMNPGLASRHVFRTLLHHPRVARVIDRFLTELLYRGRLPARIRELIIMRIAWLTGSVYEWTRHYDIAIAADLTPDDMRAVRDWRRAGGYFTQAERAALAATDETLGEGRASDETWAACAAVFQPDEVLEIAAAISNWNMFSLMLKSLGIPLEPGAAPWPPDGRTPG